MGQIGSEPYTSLSWRPGKRTDYTNTQEAKLKHTIHTDRKKETNTQGRERDKEDMHTRETERERQEERLNLLEDKDPDPKHLE